MIRIPSFKLKFSSAQEYVEYMMEKDLQEFKKYPNRPINK